MSEKIYSRLLRLYPSSFRRRYEGEALQLVRDRLGDERGFFKRARLWWDLVTDAFAGLPGAYRNSYSAPEAAALSLHAEGVPSFKVLDQQPLRRGSILVGATLSLAAATAFGFVLSHPIAYQPIAGTNGRMSPIESVLKRLNQASTPDSAVGGHRDAAGSAAAGVQQAQPSAMPNAPNTPASSTQNRNPQGDGYLAGRIKNPHQPAVDWAPPALQGLSYGPTSGNLSTNRQRSANDLPENAPGRNYDWPVVRGHELTEHEVTGQGSAPVGAGQTRLPDALSAMIQLFQSHDIVMFGEVHGNEQEYEWLCKLVRTPGFADHVDDIVVEFGNALDQQTVDRYVAGEDVPFDEVEKAWRNMVADTEPVSPVYGWLYKAVREANMEHRGERGIRLLMGSPPGDWNKIRNSAELAPYESERDQWYAQVVKTEVLAKHRHALLIMGAGHFLRGHEEALQYELAVEQHRDAQLDKAHLGPGLIEKELRAAGAHPYLIVFGTNVVDNRGDEDRRFDAWQTPVLAPLSGNWVGALPAQPVISGGRAPSIPLTLADQADALLYVAPCRALRTVYLSHAELDGTAYEREVIRRDMLLLGHRQTFQYGALPQCAETQRASR
jgi:hypothetical protein